jgi:hypothetical protein
MIAILLIPLVYFQIALTPFYRRHLLLTNGLDPDLISERKQRRKEATKADYDAIYGGRLCRQSTRRFAERRAAPRHG